jgi:hypothetical protein
MTAIQLGRMTAIQLAAREAAERSAHAQGLPTRITDPVMLARIAELAGPPAPRRERRDRAA